MGLEFWKCAAGLIVAVFVVTTVAAQEIHPVVGELRRDFPSVAIESAASFEPANGFVRGVVASGLRARFSGGSEAAVKVLYPRFYDGLIVVEMGDQRVVLRARGSTGSPAVEASGKLVYSGAYEATDAVEVPKGGGERGGAAVGRRARAAELRIRDRGDRRGGGSGDR